MAAKVAHPESIVETSWVADHLNDDNVAIVEVDVDTEAYDQGHVPGAVGWNWTTQLNDTITRDILSKEQMQGLLGGSGIAKSTTVVLYGDNNNWFAAYAFWQMKLYGHRRLKLMNGGRQKWVDEGRDTNTDVPSPAKRIYRASDADPSIRATREYVIEVASTRNNVGLIDVRAPAEFSGELLAPANLPQEGSQRGGHIPGAANVPWATAVNAADGTFKTVEELRDVYLGKGLRTDNETIAYCRIGERSSHTWFVLSEILGFNKVRNYDGSWTEYGSVVGAPIEK
jgi:thiosulfate/3-mercaptopyruvate sulfurtransferase